MSDPVGPGNNFPADGTPFGGQPQQPVGGGVGGAGGAGGAGTAAADAAKSGGPSPLVWIVGALAAALVVVGGIIFFTSGGDDGDATPAPPAAVAVPSVVGFSLEEATKSLEGMGFTVGNISQIPSDQPVGVVLEQNPLSGTQLVQGSPVDLVVAGDPLPLVPDVEMMKEQDAVNTLLAAGLKVGTVKKTSSPEPAGEVLAQFPKAGQQVDKDTPVNLTISNGKTGVPDVLGMAQAEAEANLANAGFKYVVQETEAQDRIGLVIAMTPKAGTKAKAGTTVTITVVKAAQPLPTPTPTPTPTPKPKPTPTPTPQPTQPIGGQAKCDLATFTEFVEAKQEAAGVPLQKINDFTCDNGWAVVLASVGQPDQTLIKRFILEAEGQFWVQRKQETVCLPGSNLPDSLRDAACEPLLG